MTGGGPALGRRNSRNGRETQYSQQAKQAKRVGACWSRSRVLAFGEPRDDGVMLGPDGAALPRRLDAGVGGAAGGAVVHDLLVAGVGQVLAAPEDREGLVELVLGVEIEAGIGRQLVDLVREIVALADIDDRRLDRQPGVGRDHEAEAALVLGPAVEPEAGLEVERPELGVGRLQPQELRHDGDVGGELRAAGAGVAHVDVAAEELARLALPGVEGEIDEVAVAVEEQRARQLTRPSSSIWSMPASKPI